MTKQRPAILRTRLTGYAVAVLIVAVATGIRMLLATELGTRLPFFTYYLAVMFVAWYRGLGPALLAIILSAPVAFYYFIPTEKSFILKGPEAILNLAIFIFLGVVNAALIEALHRTARRAEESEEQFRMMADSAPVMVWMSGADAMRNFFNKTWLDFTGRTFEQEKAGDWAEDAHADDRKRVRDTYLSSFEARRPFKMEYRLRRHDGQYRWVLDNGVPRFAASGEFKGYIGSCVDITERKQAEDIASFLASIVESSDDAIIGKTLDGTIISWNRGAQKIYGYTTDEMKGRNVATLAPPDRADEIPAILEKLKRGEPIHHFETVRVKKDGAQIDVELTISPIRDSEGNITAASTIARDITERKRAEEERAQLLTEIEEQRQRLNNIITNVPGVVWEAWGQPGEDAQRIDYVSDYVEQMLGYSTDEWLATPNFWLQITHPEDKQRAATEAAAIYESRAGGVSRFRWLAKDGRVVWVEAQSVVVCDRAGNPLGMRGVTMDITERKRAEENERFLAEASKLLSSSLDYSATLASVADLIVPRLADWCAVHIVEEDGQARQLAIAHADPEKIEATKELARRYPYDPGATTGVANVLRRGKSEFYPRVSQSLLKNRDESHFKLLGEVGMKSGMIVPMVARGRSVGTITFVIAESNRYYEESDLHLAEDLANRAALAVDNARLYRETEQARGRLAFVAEASAILASSLDYTATLESTVRLAIPEFADWCVVDVVEPGGQINRVTVAAADKEKERVLEEMRKRYPPTWNSPQPATRALRAGESIILNNLEGQALAETTRDEEHLKMVQKLGPHSAIAVPLVARAHTLGAITFALSDSNRQYTMDDLSLAEELAHRAAVAVDNARLYGEAQTALREREESLRLRDEFLEREQAAREEAEAANRTKDEFLATVSHELRTPLNAILGWSHMLRRGDLDPNTHARALETIERNARSQAQLIEDILDVSRIITGKLRLDVQPVELVAVVEAAIDSVRLAAEAKDIRLQSVLDPRAGPISGDPNRLQQVVWNLISNAVKFTPKGGRVQVRLEKMNSHIEIIVSDTGQGISQDFLPHVFDRFRQGDASSTRRHGGLGLGLAIVRHLIEMHGGTVTVESAGADLGTSFTVKLPLLILQSASLDAGRAHPTSGGSRELNPQPRLDSIAVMVVDDERDTRDMLKTALERLGATVRDCESSDEAIATLGDWRPDIIISDIEMPGEDGYEFIRRVRHLKDGAKSAIPAVALTAYARTEDRLRSLAAGYQMHIAKPVDLSELAVVILSLSSRSGRSQVM